jgi:hypothetical protein
MEISTMRIKTETKFLSPQVLDQNLNTEDEILDTSLASLASLRKTSTASVES